MATRRTGARLALALLGLTASTTPGRTLAICVDSRELAIQQNQCIQRGAAVMSKYFPQTQHDTGAVFGFRGRDNAAAILCDRARNNSVFFSVASTDEAVCRQDILKLKNEF